MNTLAPLPDVVAPAAGRHWPMPKWLTGQYHLLFALVWLVGLLVRVPYLTRDTAITSDIRAYLGWLTIVRDQGLLQAYSGTSINYPPLFLEWLSLASAGMVHLPAVLRENAAVAIAIVKLPSLLADMLTAAALAAAFRRLGPWPALGAAAAYLFNPAIWYVSSFWGQTDALYCLFLVLAILALWRGSVLPAWAALALALGFKVQAGVLAPLLVVATWRQAGWRQLSAGLIVFASVTALIWAPWLVTGQYSALWNILQEAPPAARLVVTAYNLWYLARGGHVAGVLVTERVAGLPFTYRSLSVAVYTTVVLVITAVAWRVRRMRLAALAALYCLALFVYMHSIHERYLFPVLALVLLGLAEPGESRTVQRGLWLAYLLLSITYLFNLVTIASFNPRLWINLMVPQAQTTAVGVLFAMSLLAAAAHIVATGWLLICVVHSERPLRAAL